MTSPIGFEVLEHRYTDGYIFTRVYQLAEPIGPIKYILTMAKGSEDGTSGVRGRPRVSPDKMLYQDIEALDALDDGVVNEVAVIQALPDSDEAHELALATAHAATLEFWEEDKHLVKMIGRWPKWKPLPLLRRIFTHWSDKNQIGGKWTWWKVWQ